jgi:hypothetical protein
VLTLLRSTSIRRSPVGLGTLRGFRAVAEASKGRFPQPLLMWSDDAGLDLAATMDPVTGSNILLSSMGRKWSQFLHAPPANFAGNPASTGASGP